MRDKPSEIDALVLAAREAARQAYCPYSRFAVGAVLQDGAGALHNGCNIENASYGLTLCAERVALAGAVGAGVRAFTVLVIAGGSAEAPAVPCGACLQVLSEFCDASLAIYLVPLSGQATPRAPRRHTLGEFLPRAFRLGVG